MGLNTLLGNEVSRFNNFKRQTMKLYYSFIKNIYLVLLLGALISCGTETSNDGHDHHDHEGHNHGDDHSNEVQLSNTQFEAMDMKVAPLASRNMSAYVDASGKLEVPPQNEATVTAVIGANVGSIKVIEGDEVKKGQVLAYISHPDLVSLQTDYVTSWSQLQYLEKDYERQKKLYEEKVGSAKAFESVQASYLTATGQCKGYEAKLSMLGISASSVRAGNIASQIPIKSPIDGHVRMVEVKIGQFVEPQTEMFEIVNINHIHADLMVFEKDMHLVKVGQKVRFSVESIPDRELEATIYSVGKAFEQEPKAIHLHADISTKEGLLIPGTYINGRIMIEEVNSMALPEEAVVREDGKYYTFTASRESNEDEVEWLFEPLEVQVGTANNGWVEISLLKKLSTETSFVQNNAYYLMAELKKEEAEHSH